MSETNEASQTSNHMIPKERLDEVLARAKATEQQLQFTQQQLSHLVQSQRPQQAQQVDPEMERIKEENPSLYKRLLKAEQDARQTRAAFFGIADKTDKMEFLQTFGDKGKKRMAEVESLLEQARNAGNFNANRGSIYQHLLGQDKIREEFAPKAPVQEAPPAVDVPPSDPRQVATVKGGTAAPDLSTLTREDRVKFLENVEF